MCEPLATRGPGSPGRRLLLLLLLLAVAGCGERRPAEPTDAEHVSTLISRLSGAAHDANEFSSLFAEGAVPPDTQRPRYRRLMFYAAPRLISCSGDSATATVRVKIGENDQPLGEAEWTAVRVDGRWKLNSAPLPDG